MEGSPYEDFVLEVLSKVEGDATLIVINASGLTYEVSDLNLNHEM